MFKVVLLFLEVLIKFVSFILDMSSGNAEGHVGGKDKHNKNVGDKIDNQINSLGV